MLEHPLADAVDLPRAEVNSVLTLDQSGEHLPCNQTLDGHFNRLKGPEVIALKVNEHRAQMLAEFKIERLGDWLGVEGLPQRSIQPGTWVGEVVGGADEVVEGVEVAGRAPQSWDPFPGGHPCPMTAGPQWSALP